MIAQARPNPVFSDDYAVIRRALLQARTAAGVSQRTLASRLRRSASHVQRIECGQRRLDALELYFFAQALGVDPGALFGKIVEGLDRRDARPDGGAVDHESLRNA
jgi:transcriptional regulator with XRE-family HTH domain